MRSLGRISRTSDARRANVVCCFPCWICRNRGNGCTLWFQTPGLAKKRVRASLSDLSSLEDVEGMSVRQLKEILARNFVNYSGCCEKWELVEKVNRLYKENEENQKSCRFIFPFFFVLRVAFFRLFKTGLSLSQWSPIYFWENCPLIECELVIWSCL